MHKKWRKTRKDVPPILSKVESLQRRGLWTTAIILLPFTPFIGNHPYSGRHFGSRTPWTCSRPRRPLFLHALSFECTSKLCINFLNQFSFFFHILKMHYTSQSLNCVVCHLFSIILYSHSSNSRTVL